MDKFWHSGHFRFQIIMKIAYIIECKSALTDWKEAGAYIKQNAKEGDESDIIYESVDGRFEPLLQLRQEFNLETKKYEPKIWRNKPLLNQLGIQDYI